jgi:hypothetical protein
MTIKDLQKKHRVLHPVITIPGERTEEKDLDKIVEEMKDEGIETSSVDPEQYKDILAEEGG